VFVHSASSVQWRLVATVETFASSSGIRTLIGNEARGFQLRASDASPSGCDRVELYVDAHMDDARTALVAGSLLSAMVRSAEAGRLDGFRIIHGQHWIDDCASTNAGQVSNGTPLDPLAVC
jgi:hypothetical protein